MRISIEKAPPYYEDFRSTNVYCDNTDCKKIPEFFRPDFPVTAFRRPIREGTIIAKLDLNILGPKYDYKKERIYYFCRDCIDLVLVDMRIALDTRLWAFH